MSHNEERTHWLKEGAIGLGIGVIYGVTVVVVGHVSMTDFFLIISYFFLIFKSI